MNNDKNIETLLENIHIHKGTVTDQTDHNTNNIGELIDLLEKDFLDSSFYFDENIESLIDYLYDGDFNDQQIIAMNKAHYGTTITFTYFTDLDMHMMEIGNY